VAAGDQVGGGDVGDAVAGIHGQVAKGEGQVGLADAGGADQQHVGVLVDEPQGGQLLDEGAVDGGLGVEVEVFQPPGGREGGKAEPALLAACLGGGDLDAEQVLQERGVAELGRTGVVQGGGQCFGGGLQAQVVQVAAAGRPRLWSGWSLVTSGQFGVAVQIDRHLADALVGQ
jgi:hypothetical protein